MGLFSFLGKAVKGVAKVVGTAAKIGGSLGIIPGGGLIGKAANVLLASKRPMTTSGIKMAQADPRLMRGNVTQGGYGPTAYRTPGYGYRPPPAVLRLSPVMPGGAVATAGGMMARTTAPPAAYGGRATGAAPKRRRRKAASSSSSSSSSRRRKRRGGKTRAKFGSKAWRKFYGLDRKRAKRR